MKDDRPLRLALLAEAEHPKTQQWCEGLARAGADVHVLSLRGDAPAYSRFYRLPTFGLQGRSAYLAAVPAARRFLRAISPDVVVAYSVTAYGFMATLSGVRPLVQVTSGSDVLLAPRSPVMRRLVQFNLRQADLVTAWAPHMAVAAQRLGAHPQLIYTLPRGIPFERFAVNGLTTPPGNDVLRVVSTRFLEPLYKIERVIDAVGILKRRHLATRLTIAGDGSEMSALQARVRGAGLHECVRFLGRVANSELPRVFTEQDVYVSVSESDGVSASLLEAMAAGLFPVVHDNQANRQWVRHEVNGLLIDEPQAAALAETLAAANRNASLRASARITNREIIRERADLARNSVTYVNRFAALVRDFRHTSRLCVR